MPDLSQAPGPDNPTLNIAMAAVCLHFVENPAPSPSPFVYPSGSVFQSMELDLLAYRFQDPPPFGSSIEQVPAPHSRQRRPILIEYPKQFTYHSEGRAEQLRIQAPLRRADLLVSSTRFAACGRRIWHLVITPRKGETFSEYDLIMLIHLYDGRTERTGLHERIRFRLDDADSTGCLVSELPRRLGLPLQANDDPELKCGTLATADRQRRRCAATPVNKRPQNVFDTLRSAREADGEEDCTTAQNLDARRLPTAAADHGPTAASSPASSTSKKSTTRRPLTPWSRPSPRLRRSCAFTAAR